MSNSRWDTSQHRPDDPERKNPDGKRYNPVHDIQMIVDGDAAAALGELFKDRWKWATDDLIDLKPSDSVDPWPQNLSPDLKDIPVAIARTMPAYIGREEVQETKKLYQDGIAAAEKFIYIENQYLTSVEIAKAFASSLSQE